MQRDHRAGLRLALTALASIAGFGCATVPAGETALEHSAHPKIQLVFKDATGADTFHCDGTTKTECGLEPQPADHFQQAGTKYIFVKTDCQDLLRIQIEDVGSDKPVATVQCAQQQ